MTTTARAATTTTADAPLRAGSWEAIASEWTKVRTLRAFVVATVVLAAAFPALAAVVAVTASLQPDDTILGASVLAGATVGQILAAALGASTFTSEVRSGTIRPTLVACPRRTTVLAAKAAVTAAVTFALTLGASLAAYGVGVVLLDGDAHATGDPFPALVGVAVTMAAVASIGVGIGAAVRHAAGAMAAVVALTLLPSFVAPLTGGLQRWVGGASPHAALQKLTQSSDATDAAVGSLGAWPSVALVVAYAAVSLLGAARLLDSRDV